MIDVQHYKVGDALRGTYSWILLAHIGANYVVAISPYGNRYNNPALVHNIRRIVYDEACSIYEMSNVVGVGNLKLSYKFDDNQHILKKVFTETSLKLGDVVIQDSTCAILSQVDYGRAGLITLDGQIINEQHVGITQNPNISRSEYLKMGGSLDDYCVGAASAVLTWSEGDTCV